MKSMRESALTTLRRYFGEENARRLNYDHCLDLSELIDMFFFGTEVVLDDGRRLVRCDVGLEWRLREEGHTDLAADMNRMDCEVLLIAPDGRIVEVLDEVHDFPH
jgi:hypothetical protein